MKFSQLIFLIALAPIVYSCENQKKISFEVTSYSWNKIPIRNFNVPFDTKFSNTGNSIIKRKDSLLYILPIDTSNIIIQADDKQFNIAVISNPLFNPKWTKLPLGIEPTPLTDKQREVFRNYSHYRLINKPISEYIKNDPNSIIDSISGKITMLNFWYYGCLPCMAEIPALNKLHSELKHDPQVKIYSLFKDSIIYIDHKPYFQSRGISTLDSNKFKEVDIDIIQIPNSEIIAKQLFIKAYPTNLIIDEMGIIRKIQIGASMDESENFKNIDSFRSEVNKLKTAANNGFHE